MHPLTIRSVSTRVVEVPFRRPLATSIGSFNKTPFLLIDLLTEEGVTGRSYTFGYRPERSTAAGDRAGGDRRHGQGAAVHPCDSL